MIVDSIVNDDAFRVIERRKLDSDFASLRWLQSGLGDALTQACRGLVREIVAKKDRLQ